MDKAVDEDDLDQALDDFVDLTREHDDGDGSEEEKVDASAENGDDDDDDATTCCICLDSVALDTQGFLIKCVHTFHFDCIAQWANVTNLCPMCKTRFHTIVKRDADGNDLTSLDVKNTKQVHTSDGASEDIRANANLFNEYACMLCGNGDNEAVLLICEAENCEHAAHTYCLPLPAVPPSHWYCPTHIELPPPALSRALGLATTLASLRSSRRSRRSSVRLPTRRISQLEARIGVRRGQRVRTAFENEVSRYYGATTSASRLEMQSVAARDLRRMQAEAARILNRATTTAPAVSTLTTPRLVSSTPPVASARKRRVDEIQAILAASPAHQAKHRRVVVQPRTFEGQFQQLKQQMTQAQVLDTSTPLPTASKLRLLPTVKRFVDSLQSNAGQMQEVLEWGFLSMIKSWLEPYGPGKLQHPQVMDVLLAALTTLPIEKEHLKESDGLGRVVTQLVASKQLDMRSHAAATHLLATWSSFVRKPDDDESKRPPPLPPVAATQAATPVARSTTTPLPDKQVIVGHIKQQLYPAYHRGVLTKERFKDVARQVSMRFMKEMTRLSSTLITSDGALSALAQRRLNQLIDQATAAGT
ncbi:Aste57867_21998 [Aphanomyces stellatus]|uniref:Aste57867_21998 protein n=1 Tax=Aphanomyces stellatus TaxID=120398 RepID=A0A485LJ19_9STRA|nr:hypothetical protein As57867_021929 [Aphanomyces stellatus]VFT98666.1 Aste57867_21998 [Aphanomyces stellatus]